MEQTNDFDIVIIGSGLGGLSCGSILSQRGYKVCVLEQHFQIGGCLQDFKRKGRVFDTGMHYIGSYADGQILNTLFRYFDIYDKIDVQELDNDGFDVLKLNNLEFRIPQGIDTFKNKLLDQFPDEYSAINAYFDKILSIYESVDIINLREITDFEFGLKKDIDKSVYDFVSSLTDNKDLQNILCYCNSLYAGKKDSAPLFIHALISIFYLQSAWKLKNGGGQIAEALASVITKNGGQVLTKSKVTRLNCIENHVHSIEINGTTAFTGKRYISSIDPLTTMQLLDGAKIRKAFLSRLKNQKQTVSCFSLYIILKEKTVPFQNSNLYYYNLDNVWGLDAYCENDWPQGYMLYSNESKEHKGYADSLIVLSPMHFEEMKPWADTQTGKRNNAYKDMKLKKANAIIDLLEKQMPDIKNSIESIHTSTPLTYRDYTGVRDGAMYGVLTDCRKPYESQLFPKTNLTNLFLTGQNVNLHGVLGVSVGAILTCGEMEGINKIISDLKKHKKNN